MLKVVGSDAVVDEQVGGRALLDEIAREGARRMLLAALETEVAAYLDYNQRRPHTSLRYSVPLTRLQELAARPPRTPNPSPSGSDCSGRARTTEARA
jgi:hypothetical protein